MWIVRNHQQQDGLGKHLKTTWYFHSAFIVINLIEEQKPGIQFLKLKIYKLKNVETSNKLALLNKKSTAQSYYKHKIPD